IVVVLDYQYIARHVIPRALRFDIVRPEISRIYHETSQTSFHGSSCFHLGTQSSVTQEHLPSPNGGAIRPKCLFWVTLGYAGFGLARTENPRVGGSIPPLATI